MTEYPYTKMERGHHVRTQEDSCVCSRKDLAEESDLRHFDPAFSGSHKWWGVDEITSERVLLTWAWQGQGPNVPEP